VSDVEKRLEQLGLELPEPAAPAANYVPYVRTGSLVFISGQVPVRDGHLPYRGKVGAELDLKRAQEAARLAGINVLAVAREACDGNLNRIVRCVKLSGFVNCTADFDQQPAVLNGASDLMVEVLGEKGRHARFAVGSNSLPFDVSVEIDAVFEIED